ncbi:MAG: hypothetical protein WCR92_09185, partial [Candidatus Cloacimonadaceae bacterium]
MPDKMPGVRYSASARCRYLAGSQAGDVCFYKVVTLPSRHPKDDGDSMTKKKEIVCLEKHKKTALLDTKGGFSFQAAQLSDSPNICRVSSSAS